MWRAATRFSCIVLAGVVCACGGTESTGDAGGIYGDPTEEAPAEPATTTRAPVNTPGPLVTTDPNTSETATATATATAEPTETATATPTETPTPTTSEPEPGEATPE